MIDNSLLEPETVGVNNSGKGPIIVNIDPWALLKRADSTVFMRLEIPAPLFGFYDKNDTPEQNIIDRLEQCKEYDSKNPLYINDVQRTELEAVLCTNFKDTRSLVVAIWKLARIGFKDGDGIKDITLSPLILERLRTRCPRDMELNTYITKEILKSLEILVGI